METSVTWLAVKSYLAEASWLHLRILWHIDVNQILYNLTKKLWKQTFDSWLRKGKDVTALPLCLEAYPYGILP